MPSSLNGPPELGVQRFYGIGRIDQLPDVGREGVEGNTLLPGQISGLDDRCVFPAQGLSAKAPRAVFPGDEIQRMAQQMNYAGLHKDVGKNHADGVARS